MYKNVFGAAIKNPGMQNKPCNYSQWDIFFHSAFTDAHGDDIQYVYLVDILSSQFISAAL